MPFRMPVPSLKSRYEERAPDLEAMMAVVNATEPERAKYAKHLNRPGVIFQYAYYTALVREWLPSPTAVICDWGGQYGHVTRLLRRHYANVICYVPDGTEFEAEYFHQGFGISDAVRFGPGYGHPEIPLADEREDAVISSGVLEHTREYEVSETASLTEIRRVLKPGGRLFVWNLPRRWGSVELLNKVLGRSIHQYKYDRSQVRSLLGQSGFEIDLLDAHEFLNLSTRNLLGRVVGDVRAWTLDYYLSKIFLLGLFCQHFTIVAHLPSAASQATIGPDASAQSEPGMSGSRHSGE